ncbi:MAG TPA: ABC transporter substrate-binding protein [Alphaproteobacteria bacterium]|nr:ABC transporter substrate-binding protein [Alphaproteobacteria bacterium]
MWSRRTLLASAAAAAIAAISPSFARAADITKAASDFVGKLADRAIAILKNKSLSKEEREQALSRLFLEGFDVGAIGRFVLGRYWQQASEEERREYLSTFRDYVVETYAIRFNSYAGQSFVINRSTPDGDKGAMVFSDIGSPGEEPAHVQWRVRQAGDALKIVDVIVEGVSLLVTQRSEFVSILQRNGGKVAALTKLLRDKITQLKQQQA